MKITQKSEVAKCPTVPDLGAVVHYEIKWVDTNYSDVDDFAYDLKGIESPTPSPAIARVPSMAAPAAALTRASATPRPPSWPRCTAPAIWARWMRAC
ncbi:MAG: hypothetical protein IIA03_01865 [Proteobacteria bacterium]|nr:hypothetical protein [Pseudomonadota bacterium]